MNNNGWIDRFENDEEPDYPYGRDLRGRNLYAGVMISPEAKLTVGWLDEELISAMGATEALFTFTYERDIADLGRVRLYENFRLVEDNIADNLFQWVRCSTCAVHTSASLTRYLPETPGLIPPMPSWTTAAYRI